MILSTFMKLFNLDQMAGWLSGVMAAKYFWVTLAALVILFLGLKIYRRSLAARSMHRRKADPASRGDAERDQT